MDKISITPRFNEIGPIKDDLFIIKEKSKIKKHTSKNILKYKNKSQSHRKIKKNKSSKYFKLSHSNINIFGKELILKNKFFLRNDFDREHCIKFLNEKYQMLEKPILIDEICN